MAKGRQQQFGPKEEILARLAPPAAARAPEGADQGAGMIKKLIAAATRRWRGTSPTGAGAQRRESIRRHVVAGCVLVAVLVFGVGGWASTAEISAR